MNRAHRLSSRSDFKRVLRGGARGTDDGISCAAVRTERAGPARVGFTVTRQLGGAVVRNRVKRRLRAAAMGALAAAPGGADIVLMARADLSRMNFKDLEQSVRVAMARAGAA